jgi:hypothetical protein
MSSPGFLAVPRVSLRGQLTASVVSPRAGGLGDEVISSDVPTTRRARDSRQPNGVAGCCVGPGVGERDRRDLDVAAEPS